METIIIREYLESLKEDTQLDYIFPLLLESMGFEIITKPSTYKGFQQYGKDIIAVGIDPIDQKKKRFYFELKGGGDRHITSTTYSKDDGIRASIHEAMDKDYSDNSIQGFNDLPIKIVLPHNGEIKPDVQGTFDDMIKKEFSRRPDLEFERWGISKLTQLFSKYLFNEYLLTDEENTRLFKRMLVFMDVPEYSLRDFSILVQNILSKTDTEKLSKSNFPVHLSRFFESIKLIGFITHQYSQEAGNLEISKNSLSFLVVNTWSWILKHKLEKDKRVLKRFNELLKLHKKVLDDYFEKLLPFTKIKYGLFSEIGSKYEMIGYPLRCMEFLCFLNYWFMIDEELTVDEKEEILTTFIKNNDGTYRPVLDNNSIPIVLVLEFYISNGFVEKAKKYLENVFEQILIANHLPDGKNNPESLIRLIIKGERSVFYEDRASMLIGTLFEYLAVLGMKDEYDQYRNEFLELQLSTFIPYSDDLLKQHLPEVNDSHEERLFTKELYKEGIQSSIVLDKKFDDFVNKTRLKDPYSIKYRTEEAGYGYLIYLAHILYKTPIFPVVWRKSLKSMVSQN